MDGGELTQEHDDTGDGGRIDAGQDAGQDGSEPAGVVPGKAAGQDVGDALQPVGQQGGPAAVRREGILEDDGEYREVGSGSVPVSGSRPGSGPWTT